MWVMESERKCYFMFQCCQVYFVSLIQKLQIKTLGKDIANDLSTYSFFFFIFIFIFIFFVLKLKCTLSK